MIARKGQGAQAQHRAGASRPAASATRFHLRAQAWIAVAGTATTLVLNSPQCSQLRRTAVSHFHDPRCPAGYVLVEASRCDAAVEGDFCLSRFEVTQRDFVRVMGRNPSKFPRARWDVPVTSVTWSEARAYAELFSVQTRAADGGAAPADGPAEVEAPEALRAAG